MSSHDAYSSEEEDEFDRNSKSNVLIGLVDVKIDGNEDEPTFEDTILGGQPVWLHSNSRPKDELLTCGNCGKMMAMLLQAFSPFDDELYDRVIYIFACPDTRTCSKKANSVKAIRGICKDPSKISQLQKEEETALKKSLDEKLKLEEKKKIQFEATKDLFGKGNQASNPFSASDNPFSQGENPFERKAENPFTAKAIPDPSGSSPKTEKESYADAAKKNQVASTAVRTTRADSIELPEYTSYFLYVQGEKYKKFTDPDLEKYKHLTEMDVDSGSGSGSSKGGKGGSDSSAQLDPGAAKISNMLDDTVFEAFTNKVKHNPSQVLRYELGGKPLLYTGRDSTAAKFLGKEITIPKPGYNPSSSRQFELQLMPKAIMDLESDIIKKDILEGMEWGTIIVATDVEDYIPELDENYVGYVEEWCGVQWEESV
ncbi:20S rRNA accumulation protein 4 [[Candida] railenensis]|uniref:20S rRNA accumulation protein 4 n=1 Tax=[Candida] railenensis TaxID=45579 RepID=A0A9P0QW48_9ASCO|nr:20S rRNA accumulation protein 4 [[Candida] railenensis]